MSEKQAPRIVTHTKTRSLPSSAAARKKRALPRPKYRLSMGERLLRNSAVACALLLGVLTLGSVEQPWAKKAVASVKKAISMRIDLDESLGGLTFVQKLVPESALVFFHVSGQQEYIRPSEGDVIHPWSSEQPWILFDCDSGDQVVACRGGVIAAISPFDDGSWGLLIDHDDGSRSVYAYMRQPDSLRMGQAVRQGDVLGSGTGRLYYELRQNDVSVDPTERMLL